MKIEENILMKFYSSKIILLGEYGVIHDGEILAMPLLFYKAKWIVGDKYEEYKKGLIKIYDYLQSQGNEKINLDKFLKAVEAGLKLSSTIPTGYGLGSSGSITAAIYDAFAYEKTTDFNTLKQDLIDIESCFHGVSSGIDPLVIYLNKPIHINTDGINVLEKDLDINNYFLLDTRIRRNTKPYVDQYLKRAEEIPYMRAIEEYKIFNQKAIIAQLENNKRVVSCNIAEISQWQYEHLDFAILDQHKELWKSTLDRSDVSLKLCGAGGGGFIMGYSEDVDAVIGEFCGDFDILRLE